MTVILDKPPSAAHAEAITLRQRLWALWLLRPFAGSSRHIDLMLAFVLAVGAGVTRILNLGGYPRLFTDENVYVAQAWAVQFEGQLANYTYWYDHPPVGWVQIALWSIVTGALKRQTELTTLAGREYMVAMAIACAMLMFALARRLGMRRGFAFVAAALYVLSPLAVSFSRYVLLDNIAVVWLLAAMLLALSPTRKLSSAIWSGVCMAVAVLSKETALLVVPAVVFLLVRNYWRPSEGVQGPGNRGYAILMSLAVSAGLMSFYPLYAIFKNELIPGPGHVSLWQGQVLFQLASRAGSGSILNPDSDAYKLAVNAWLGLDPWLPLVGIAALVPALFIRKLWGPALALGVQVVLLVSRQGYLPYPYIIVMLPFMALLIAGVADACWPSLAMLRGLWYQKLLAGVGVLLVGAMVFSTVAQVAPQWQSKLAYEFTTNQTLNQRQALDWAEQHLDKRSRLVTEGELWLDVRYRGFVNPTVVWVYKLDTDSAVRGEYGSVAGLDYLVLNKATIDSANSGAYSTLQVAIKGAQVVQTFGPPNENQLQILKVTAKT